MKERENKMKFVNINYCGGYELSQNIMDKYGEELAVLKRNNHKLVSAVEEFGEDKASGFYANLRIVEIPDDSTDYYINEYDGAESIIYVKDGKLQWA